MKHLATIAIAACLSACVLPGPRGDLSDRTAVVVDGQLYDIGPLTESTWTAISQPGASTRNSGVAHRAAVTQAIERTSGCRVTDSDESLAGRQLNAQVDCASRLKN